MDNVEKEFVQRDQHIAGLEATIAKRDAELKLANDLIEGQKGEMSKAMALQRTLLMQYQEAQIESKELQEFLQAEKYTLAGKLEKFITSYKKTLHIQYSSAFFRNPQGLWIGNVSLKSWNLTKRWRN